MTDRKRRQNLAKVLQRFFAELNESMKLLRSERTITRFGENLLIMGSEKWYVFVFSWKIVVIIVQIGFKEARNSFVGRAQTGFQFTRETQKLKRTNKNGIALSSGFNILRRSFESCV